MRERVHTNPYLEPHGTESVRVFFSKTRVCIKVYFQRGHIVSPLYKKGTRSLFWFFFVVVVVVFCFFLFRVLDSYFAHRYVIINYKFTSIWANIHQFL